MTSQLPQEILDTVTDWVAHGEPALSPSRPSLTALALTSRQHFTHRVQSHLFRVRVLAPDRRETTKDILAGNPSLFKHVRSLAITLQHTHPDVYDKMAESELESARLMQRALEYIDNITALVIICRKSDATRTNAPSEWATWTKISPAWREMFNKAFEKSTINILFVLGLGHLPVWKIYAMPNLSMIVLEKNSDFMSEDAKDSEEVGKIQPRPSLDFAPTQLKWMCFHRSGVLAASLIPSFFNIPHLTLEIAGLDQHTAAWDVLEKGPQRLESLGLRYSNRVSSSRRNSNLLSECLSEFKRTGRDLPTLPNLRYLAIFANASHDRSEPERLVPVPPFLPRFFVALIGQNPQPSLEVIDIMLEWGVAVEPTGQLPSGAPPMIDREDAEWRKLDERLSSRSLFPQLRAIRAVAAPDINLERLRQRYITREMEANFLLFVKPQAQVEMRSALSKCSARAAVDAELDQGLHKRVSEMIHGILPRRFLKRVETMLT